MNRCFFLFAVLLTLILAVFPFTACHDDDSDSTSLGQTDDDDHALIDDDDDDDDSGGGDDDDDDDNDDDDDDDNNNDNNDNNDDDNNDDNDTISFEYGIKTYSYTSVLPYLPNFAARGLHLYLGAGIGSIGTPELLAVLTQAEELGIDITLCPYPSSGSFANEETIDIYEADVHTLLDWTETVTGAVTTISVNMELGPPWDKQFQEAWANRDFALLFELAALTLDRERYLTSVERYQTLVHDLQSRGYLVQITTFPFLLDDIPDEDTDIQDLCNSPMTDIDWDLIAPCAYSTEYAHYVGTFAASPYFVYTYAKTARELYGNAAVVDVGLVRTSGTNGYETPDQLAADIAAAKAAGVRRIEIFSFNGMLEYPDYTFDDWADCTLVEPLVPETDPLIDLARLGAGAIDFILNFME